MKTATKEKQSIRNYPAGEDPELLEIEKEYYIRGCKDDLSKVHITSMVKSMTEFLLNVPEFEETRHYIKDGKVVHLEGIVPLSCLRLVSNPKDSMNYLSRIIR